ncbi:DUF1934 domain-containing protein [Fructilactobacillus florum]|uniref:DUF1934 domain-containing protein n=1 Tax=Fructilactobacillus florum TaxID=640331 RepID=UPI00028EF30E|nr:DUF1934 domain-containing protein [Fructilactobacillus florum]EKK20115.1 DUF1934-containing protein [Fructilactobacillus florum 2F]
MIEKNATIPVQVKLTTTVTQQGDTTTHHFVETGQLGQIQGTWYLRFQETTGHQAVPVSFRFDNQKQVRLLRNGENRLNFLFRDQAETENQYRTPFGLVKLQLKTQALHLDFDVEAVVGAFEVCYQLRQGGDPVGDYQIKLQFNS